jgi:predicted exporter
MWRNLAGWDRTLRVMLGLALLALGLSGAVGGLAGIALAIFGWLPLVTGLIGWCPLYGLLGHSTRR